MPTDPSALAASPTPFSVGGVEYRIYPFRFRDIAEFHAWVKTLHPDPRKEALALMAGLPDAVATHIYDRACEAAASWPPALDGPEVNAAVATPEGQARILHIAIKRTVAGFTVDEAYELAGRMTDEEMGRFLDIAMPKVGGGGGGGDGGPKAAAPPTGGPSS